ncbi:MAG TPA: ABC transporter permease [Thermoanaerobaculia bacterium]|nr:ABC transporter permease [Thermoanaerobaculia bacterium]
MRPVPGRRLFRFPWRTAAQVAADVDEELQFHLDMVARELVEDGWPAEAARVEALRRFGDLEGTKKFCCALDREKETQMKWMQSLEALGQDLRYAGRQLWKSPGFTLIVLLTLTLAVGASTAIFSVVDGVLLRPLPFPEADRLATVLPTSGEGNWNAFSWLNYVDLRDQTRALSGVAAYSGGSINLASVGGEPERLVGIYATSNLFPVLKVQPLIGRFYTPDEDRRGGPRLAVLSEELWERRFGRDPGLLGRAVSLNDEPFTVVGVLAREDQYPATGDVWIPFALTSENLEARGSVFFGALGRLAPGVSFEAAQTEVKGIGDRLAQQYPESNARLTIGMVPLREWMVGDFRTPLLVLLGAVLFVLLIAAVNVANLLLVRAAAREGEVAVRTALGAGRGRIVRQLLTESLVLALLGGAAGVWLAVWLTKGLVALAPLKTSRLEGVGVDSSVLLFALGITLLTGLLFGLAPALQASRTDLNGVLKEGARGSRGRAATRARSGLVVVEVALAVMLLAGAGLLLRSFDRLQSVELGFEPEGVLTFRVALPEAKYDEEEKLRAFTDGLMARLEQMPGVTAAGAMVYGLPMAPTGNVFSFSIEGRPPAPPGQSPILRVGSVTPGALRALKMRVARGRGFTAGDRPGAPQVVLINEAAVREFFPGEDPLGQRILLGWNVDGVQRGGEVVGVLADFKQDTLGGEVEPQLFLPFAQAPLRSLAVTVRTESDPAALAAEARARVLELDPSLPVYSLLTMEEMVAASASQPKFYLLLLGGFAAIAVVLAAVGIYGVIAYGVRQRTQEIGIRMALGASRDRVLRMVVRQGLTLALLGAAAGLAGALFATRGMRSLLYQVSATDPAIYVAVAVVLVAVAGFASWLPARRAAGTDPQLALRGEV